ncbi:MAG: acyl-CoA dehydrogenase [Deltaproteobacteria bacterium]|nr:MAG: acyl-CoA dehydrogenase [Deltaproteobacteria bacterium]
MFSFELTSEQQELRDSVRRFAEQEIWPKAIELDEKEEFSVELTQKMGDLGYFGLFVSDKYGGSGLDYISYILVVEELSRVDGSHAATVAAANSLGIGPIYYFGTDEQKEQWLPVLCSGQGLAGFGLTEPNAGSDAGGSKTNAKKVDGGWVINGSKIFITNSSNPMTKVIIVQAVTGERENGKKEYSCFLVPADAKGLTAKPIHGKLMWRASDTGELYFDDLFVPDSALLGNRGDGFRQMLSTLDRGRLSIAAMGVGGAQGAYELALKYAQERKQFGKPISKFQAIAFKLADMATEIEAARLLNFQACWRCQNGMSFGKEAAMAKLFASEVMRRVATEAVQVHGGYGLTKEYHVERFFRDQKLLEIGEGTSEIQRMVISRHIGC